MHRRRATEYLKGSAHLCGVRGARLARVLADYEVGVRPAECILVERKHVAARAPHPAHFGVYFGAAHGSGVNQRGDHARYGRAAGRLRAPVRDTAQRASRAELAYDLGRARQEGHDARAGHVPRPAAPELSLSGAVGDAMGGGAGRGGAGRGGAGRGGAGRGGADAAAADRRPGAAAWSCRRAAR